MVKIKNKKAQNGLYVAIVMAIMIFICGMLVMNFIRERVVSTRTTMECATNSTISDGTKLTCLVVDSVVPYFIMLIVSCAGGLILARFIV